MSIIDEIIKGIAQETEREMGKSGLSEGIYLEFTATVAKKLHNILNQKVGTHPRAGEQYRHKNGNIYTVLFLTNTQSTPERLKEHPIDVIYMGQNGRLWSRPLSNWARSFTIIE